MLGDEHRDEKVQVEEKETRDLLPQAEIGPERIPGVKRPQQEQETHGACSFSEVRRKRRIHHPYGYSPHALLNLRDLRLGGFEQWGVKSLQSKLR